eukprot:Seg1147.4 transcript_id=Seg1147.4/GoldUCD/mRNA.D3Y31 product="BTB/POZ domain-containing protein 6" protein_id=Seg1147.4/GoldUCD/D3Y31
MSRAEQDNYDWQSEAATLSGSISHLFNNELMSDFIIIVNDKRIPVHKLILASRSAVFYAMFYGQMAHNSAELKLNDCDNADIFLGFLRYIYTDDCTLSMDNVFHILNASKKYLLPSLTKKCSDFLQENINTENALIALRQSLFFEEKNVVEKCLKAIGRHAVQIVVQRAFLELDKKTLIEILKCDDLVIPEIDLFLAAEKWSTHKLIEDGREICPESKREVLGDALYLLRFPTMLSKEFCKHCLYSGLLAQQESNDLLHILCLDKEDQNDGVFDRIPFPKEPRKKNKIVQIDRLSAGRVRACRARANGAVDFTVNRTAWLLGFSVFGSLSTTQVTDVIIIKDHDKGRTGLKPSFTIAPSRSDYLLYVKLSQKIQIRSKEKTNLSIRMNGRATKYGSYSCTEYGSDGLVCNFIGATNGETEGNAIQGQFPHFVFQI